MLTDDFLDTVFICDGWASMHSGRPMSMHKVRALFRRNSLEVTLGVLQRIDFLLWDADRIEGEVQHKIGIGIFGKERWRSMLTRLARDRHGPREQRGRILFFPQQVLNAFKFALLETPDAVSQSPDLPAIAEAMLGLTDHLDPGRPHIPSGLPDPVLRHHVTFNGIFNQNDRQMSLMPLAAFLYLDSHQVLARDPNYVDIAKLLEQAIGVAPRDLITLGIATLSNWQAQDRTRIHEGAQVLNPDQYFANLSITAEAIDSFLRATSRTAAALRTAVRSRYTPDDIKPFSFVPFAETPLIQTNPRSYFCTSVKLLLRRLSTDLHYFFLQHLDENAKRAYLTFHGKAFENLVHSTLERSLKRPRSLRFQVKRTRYFRLDEVVPRGFKESVADGLMISGDRAVVLDAKAGRLPSLAWDGDVSKFQEYLDNLCLKAASQIDSTIQAVRDGRIRARGLKPKEIKHYIPLVVPLQYLGWNPLLARELKRRLHAENLLQDDAILDFQVGELETLLIAADDGPQRERGIVGLLWSKAQDATATDISLHNYLVSLGAEVSWRTPYLRKRNKKLFKTARSSFRPDAHN